MAPICLRDMEPGFQILSTKTARAWWCASRRACRRRPRRASTAWKSASRRFCNGRDDPPGDVYLGIPHRLDRPASGAIVFATRRRAAHKLSEAVRASLGEEALLGVRRGAARSARGHVAGLRPQSVRQAAGRSRAARSSRGQVGRAALSDPRVGRLGLAGWRSNWRPAARTRSASKPPRAAIPCWAIFNTGRRLPSVRSTTTSGCWRSRCTRGCWSSSIRRASSGCR